MLRGFVYLLGNILNYQEQIFQYNFQESLCGGRSIEIERDT